MNKKIRGAKKKVLDGITFDSHLEAACYRELKSAGIEFEYNSNTYEIFPGVRLNKVNFIESKVKNRGYHQYFNKKGEKLKLVAVKYTPDFVIKSIDDTPIFIETKGRANDVYPYKRRMFFKKLEDDNTIKEAYFFEPRTVKQIKESIEQIKLILNVNRDNSTT